MAKLQLLDVRCNGSCASTLRLRPYFLGSAMGGSFFHDCPSDWEDIPGSYVITFPNGASGFLELKYQGELYNGVISISSGFDDDPPQVDEFDLPSGCTVKIRWVVLPT
ncbi:MAG: hypothetical protein VKL39_02295 [Leptolyngbyaceae bacterium]|nr:hypothetical protein [Leptolyngbyaceae bacterium]